MSQQEEQLPLTNPEASATVPIWKKVPLAVFVGVGFLLFALGTPQTPIALSTLAIYNIPVAKLP